MKFKDLYESECLHARNAWADIIFVHPFSIPLSKFLAKFKVNPNIVTFATVPVCLVAAYLFATGNLVLGAFVYWLNYILDGTDGELARLLKKQSVFGSKWDARTDTINHLAMYTGLWYSQYYLFGDWLIGFLLIVIHYATTIYGVIILYDTSYKTFSPRVFSYYSSFEEGWGTFFLAPFLGMFWLLFPILVGLQVLTHVVLTVTRFKKIGFEELKTRIKTSLLRVME